jgi:hypothetical protein
MRLKLTIPTIRKIAVVSSKKNAQLIEMDRKKGACCLVFIVRNFVVFAGGLLTTGIGLEGSVSSSTYP